MITKEQERIKRLRAIMDEIHGVIYALDALADMRTEATHTLRNFARELDHVFIELDEIAETLEQAHGTSGEGAANADD